MKENCFNEEKAYEGYYSFNDTLYMIQDGRVFRNTAKEFDFRTISEELVYLKSLSPEKIRANGKLATQLPTTYELKITEIKKIGENKALIHANDGLDFDFWIYEGDYKANASLYRINEVCTLSIVAEILSAELPEAYNYGRKLTEEELNTFAYLHENDCHVKSTENPSFSIYKQTADFFKNGVYSFFATETEARFGIPTKETPDMCSIPAMNQFLKDDPRYVRAVFSAEPYTFPEFHDDDFECFQLEWRLQGTLRFIASKQSNDSNIVKTVYGYGKEEIQFDNPRDEAFYMKTAPIFKFDPFFEFDDDE